MRYAHLLPSRRLPTPRRLPRLFAAALPVMLLAGCASGPVKRVSEPAVAVQELQVRADGSWQVSLRLQNFSNVPMRFDRVSLRLDIDSLQAGRLEATPAFDVGPESADTTKLDVTPSAEARIAVATALAEGRRLPYSLEGEVVVTPREGRGRDYTVKRRSALNPVPGLPGVLR